jgi:hypothetical protein
MGLQEVQFIRTQARSDPVPFNAGGTDQDPEPAVAQRLSSVQSAGLRKLADQGDPAPGRIPTPGGSDLGKEEHRHSHIMAARALIGKLG